jgi:predicted house-cleaning noncanonical NTP pyrophosphatase (MazG superfamily)
MTAKLVRDLIPDIMRADNVEPVVRILRGAELESALCDKLDEEIAEVRAASDVERPGEIADAYEVLRAISRHEGMFMSDLADLAQRSVHPSDEGLYDRLQRCSEHVRAADAVERPQTLAAAYDALSRIAGRDGLDMARIEQIADRKREARGGFEGGVFVENC